MQRFLGTPRFAFVDLTFNWPPVGGCWIDTHHIIQRIQKRGAKVCLFVPDFQTYYPRGYIQTEMPYPVVTIPFNRFSYNFSTVMKRFGKRVEEFQPDLIFLSDGYQMKNHLMTALGAHRCILRFYAYELLCINLHYYRYHEDRICTEGFFHNPKECHRCWFRRMPAIGRGIQIAIDWPETHPKLHFSQEYLASLAFSEGYHQTLMENFNRLNTAVVYNDFMKGQLSPYVSNIHIIPSGVDTERFSPTEDRTEDNEPVKIFLPGRANDPLKGLPVLINALNRLAKEGLKIELHYTAAMNCDSQEPWLVNRGWVNQDELPGLYSEMDIVVVPSTWIEPFGITALEGMASGLPVVASRIGGLAHSVVHDQTGYHFEPGDANGLAQALRTLIVDHALRKQFGQNGRERVLKHYDWNRIVDNHYVSLFEAGMSRIRNENIFAAAD